MTEEELLEIGKDLQKKIIDLIAGHPAKQDTTLVYSALADIALTILLTQMDIDKRTARDIWNSNFKKHSANQ